MKREIASMLAAFGAGLGQFKDRVEDLEEIEIQCPDSSALERTCCAGVFVPCDNGCGGSQLAHRDAQFRAPEGTSE